MSELCHICKVVLSKWDLGKYAGIRSGMHAFAFGDLNEIRLRKDCPLCHLLLSLVPLPEPCQTDAGSEAKPAPTLAGQIANLGQTVGNNDPCDLNVYLNGKVEDGKMMMDGRRLGSLTTKQLWGPDFVDVPISGIRWKIQNCQALHSKESSHEYKERPGVRIWLIDVLNSNICERAVDERFLALSYVWGDTVGLQALMNNRQELAKAGSLINLKSHIPQVIKDAMHVTRMLEEQYLWVDSLCIEQDNPDHKAEQIAIMDQIYLRSVLTIVALNGQSGQAPLPGVNPGTSLNPRASATVNGRQLFVRPPSLFETFESSKYESRGWTFQERCLSPRLLLFTPHAWYYHCHGTLVSNGLWWQKKGHAGYNSLFETLNLLRGPGEDFTTKYAATPEIAEFFRYEAVVLVYTARHLSFSSDVLNAVSALLVSISTKMQSAFVHGLPERFFGLALLWIPTGHYPANSGPRRMRNTDNEGKALFPSWTWLGWTGQSHYSPGLIIPCFPWQDDIDNWPNGQDSVGFVDEIDSYAIAMDGDGEEERPLHTTKHPDDFVFPGLIDNITIGGSQWSHLTFSAWTADASQFSLHAANANVPWCGGAFQNVKFENWHPTRIMDGKSHHCGCLYEFVEEGFDLNMDITHCRFIALSSSSAACLAPGACCDPAKPLEIEPLVKEMTVIEDDEANSDDSDNWESPGKWDDSKPRHECQIKYFMFDKTHFKPAEWCFVNVMLVSWAHNRAERLGVGIIHREAWLAANRIEEKVHLY